MPILSLTDAQVAAYAQAAGFDGNDLVTATAIAHAESNDNPNAHNATPPDDSFGLWQINMFGSLGPSRRQMLGISSNDALFDPATNARAAYMIYTQAGHSFTPWSTYNNGAYRKYVNSSLTIDPGGISVSKNPDSPISNSGDPTGLLASFHSLVNTVREGMLSFFVVLLALVLIIIGIFILNRKRAVKLVKTAGKVASKVPVI